MADIIPVINPYQLLLFEIAQGIKLTFLTAFGSSRTTGLQTIAFCTWSGDIMNLDSVLVTGIDPCFVDQ
jgi:hypothetical protein